MQPTINGKAAATLQALLGDQNKVVAYEVKNNWLIGTIANGMRFWIKNA